MAKHEVKTEKGQYAPKNITGVRIGMLTAIEPTGERNGNDGSLIWLFKCDCGNTRKVSVAKVSAKWPPYSCGCSKKENRGQAEVKDLKGFRNLMVTALEPTEKRTKGGHAVWKLICDCGNVFERPSYCMLRRTVKSCGCKVVMPPGRPRIPNSGAHVNQLVTHYRRSAEDRKLEFKLTKEQFRHLREQSCTYCGVEHASNYTHNNLSRKYSWNGIDRVDSSKGYTFENCVTSCKYCNFAKGTRSVDEFKEWICQAYKHLFST